MGFGYKNKTFSLQTLPVKETNTFMGMRFCFTMNRQSEVVKVMLFDKQSHELVYVEVYV